MFNDSIDTSPEALREISDSIRHYVETQHEIIRNYLTQMSSLTDEIETHRFRECLNQIHSSLLEMDSLKSAGLAFCTFLIAKAVMLEEQRSHASTSTYPQTNPHYSSSGSWYYPTSSSATTSSVPRTYTPSSYTSSVRSTTSIGSYGTMSTPRVTSTDTSVGTESLSSKTITSTPPSSNSDRTARHSTISVPKGSENGVSGIASTGDNTSETRNRTKAKLPSKSFKRLMKMRGNDKIKPGAEDTLENEIQGSTDGGFEVIHGYKGDRYYIVSSEDGEKRGIYLTKEEVKNLSPEEIIDLLALPPGNDASVVRMVELAKDQFIIVGKIKEQSGFAKEANDGIERVGGGTQYITNGGFAGGAIREVDLEKNANKDSPLDLNNDEGESE